jgi:hypothetical protein
MLLESSEKWEPIDGIATPSARALIKEDHKGLVVILVFSEIVDAPQSDLRINFGRVPAYTVYEEFVHPWNDPATEYPTLVGNWGNYTYPLLLIQNSDWMNSLSKRLITHPDCVHYRFVTLDQIVDVLSSKVPEVSWVKPVES